MNPLDEHNARLIDLVHPVNWVNPTPAPRYNLVVIGAGTAGLVAAAGAAGLGAKVALIERHLMGGDCLNFGCVPSKAFLSAARAASSHHRAEVLGMTNDPDARSAGSSMATGYRTDHRQSIDFVRMMERLRRLRAEIAPNDSAARFQSLGVDVFLGGGRFTGRNTIEVESRTLRFTKAVIATGARASIPDIPGLRESKPLTNETVFELTELPARIAILGGGPIGCELSQAFSQLGSKVTLIERSSQLLGREDGDAARLVKSSLERDGVQILFDTELMRTEGPRLFLRSNESSREIVVDQILIAAGRTPNVDGLHLEAAGVSHDTRGVIVDDHLRTTNPNVFAAGDVCSRYKFTHAADFMARSVLQNALFLGRASMSSLIIPWCTYTTPEVARVGMSEHEANERGIAVNVFKQELEHVDRSVLEGETNGFVKILAKRGTDKIVGAAIVAPHAGEMIGEIVLAMNNKIGLSRLGSTIHPYPTVSEAIRKCGDAYNRTRLTPLVKQLFERWLAWNR